ncbi:MAG: thioredoxin family protein [Victivallales bacterium]|nr:thioredoxin family protein [Victivallales bacterium]
MAFIFGFYAIAYGNGGSDSEPFAWHVRYNDDGLIVVEVEILEGHYLYADDRTEVVCEAGGKALKAESWPEVLVHGDEFGSGPIFAAGRHAWKFLPLDDAEYSVSVDYQGCRKTTPEHEGICYLPSNVSFDLSSLSSSGVGIPEDAAIEVSDSSDSSLAVVSSRVHQELENFNVLRSGGGYMNKKQLLDFLRDHSSASSSGEADPLKGKGIVAVIILVLIGGLMLNLTPCVLPMIPVNLAIIGAGSVSDSRGGGFVRGAVYALGISLAYGVLGIVSVAGGARLGTLSSTGWFNLAVSAVFFVLAAAMFDIVSIDFSIFSPALSRIKPGKGSLLPVFFLGALAALLAGACVAPVVIAVLLHSAALYAAGSLSGLLLPLVLGVGMALPWPFAGAGIKFLPKPGAWMIRVKQIMGAFIVLVAVYYAYLGVSLFSYSSVGAGKTSFLALESALEESAASGKPVLIDFWATWCKNCLEMDRTTMKEPEVIERLGDFVFVKFQAEDISDPDIRRLLDRFGIVGLPGFVILRKKEPNVVHALGAQARQAARPRAVLKSALEKKSFYWR